VSANSRRRARCRALCGHGAVLAGEGGGMSESRVAKATIRDDARLEALAEAEEEHGSLADAIRFRSLGKRTSTATTWARPKTA